MVWSFLQLNLGALVLCGGQRTGANEPFCVVNSVYKAHKNLYIVLRKTASYAHYSCMLIYFYVWYKSFFLSSRIYCHCE